MSCYTFLTTVGVGDQAQVGVDHLTGAYYARIIDHSPTGADHWTFSFGPGALELLSAKEAVSVIASFCDNLPPQLADRLRDDRALVLRRLGGPVSDNIV